MAIMNYSTEVPAERTVGEITALLIRKGARSITTEFSDAGDMTGISFMMPVGGVPIFFRLPANVDGVFRALKRDEPWSTRRNCNATAYEGKLRMKAKWVAWRILKDWVAAQCALIESNQAEAAQVFMPYAQQNDGQTMFHLWLEANQKLLGSGGGAA